ncbi:MAG: hypothetical protein IT377_12170 [Polyangiaceae bacterium]|nr:hypothetical protein [Polyangiaceae bacterium]
MDPQVVTPAAVVGGVLMYMAKSIYELVVQRKAAPAANHSEFLAVMARLASVQEQQTQILQEIRQSQIQVARDVAMLLAKHGASE